MIMNIMFNIVLIFAHYLGNCREFWIFAKKDKKTQTAFKKEILRFAAMYLS